MNTSTDRHVLQLLQRDTELYEKARKEHQLEKEKLQAILAMLVKAKSKKRKDDNDDKSRSKKDAHDDDINDGMTILQGKKDNEDDAPAPPLWLSPLPRSLQMAVDTKAAPNKKKAARPVLNVPPRLRARVETFQTQVRGLDVESLRERYTPEELQQAVNDRTMYNDCLHSHHLISVAATDNNKRKREDNNTKAEKEAKKLSDRAKKIATALAKEDESFQDNSWELNQMNAIVKCSLFIKDYNNCDVSSSVKEMVRYLCW